MAIYQVVVSFFFTLALAKAEAYSSQALKGSVTCIDCPRGSGLSGLQVLVKCDKVKKMAMVYTEEDGAFETKLPSDEGRNSTNPPNCMAKIMGGPHQLYVSAKDSVIPVGKDKESGHFTVSRPLGFYKSCPVKGKCGDSNDEGFGSSKTVDVPLPREWGLAPSSYYMPFLPIIGIP